MKYVIIDSVGQIGVLGGIMGPVREPVKLTIDQIYQLLITQKKVYEVRSLKDKSIKVELDFSNYNKNNFSNVVEEVLIAKVESPNVEIPPVIETPIANDPIINIEVEAPVVVTEPDSVEPVVVDNNEENVQDISETPVVEETESPVEETPVVDDTEQDSVEPEKVSEETVVEEVKEDLPEKKVEEPKKPVSTSKNYSSNNKNNYKKNNNSAIVRKN